MYYLTCLAILGTALGIPLSNEVSRDLSAVYELPRETYPTFYDIRIFLDPDNPDYFFGNVSITISTIVPTNRIVLHAMDMEIDEIEVSDSNSTDILLNYSLFTDDTHFLSLELTEELQPQELYTIHISYTGQYATNMFGLYVSSYEEWNGTARALVTSQLQPIFARRAFPCYDDPAIKAVFRITIYAPPEYKIVRSNTVIRNDALHDEVPGWSKHEFEDTPRMSTYLVAFLVSNLYYMDNVLNPIHQKRFTLYSRLGTQIGSSVLFGIDFGQRNMEALEEYIGIPYAISKMDMVAVPDFAAAATENWGLVLYRETSAIVPMEVMTTAAKQNVARNICHQNAHQWFGNEVSPRFWSFLWVNEGLANLLEYYATDLVFPEWRMMDQFVLTMHKVFQSDVYSVNPLNHAVLSPSEILGGFYPVIHQKAASVIRMLQHYMNPEQFRQGLTKYIENNARGSASSAHFGNALQEAMVAANRTGLLDINVFIFRWISQPGFPVVNVNRYSLDSQYLFTKQTRFVTGAVQDDRFFWHIPINWVLSTDPDFEDTSLRSWMIPADQWTTQMLLIEDLPGADWYMLNKQQTGYFRLNYDVRNWEALINQLNSDHTVIHVLNRAQLLDDSLNLARSSQNYLDYKIALDLSSYLVNETDYIPWATASNAFSYLDLMLRDSSEYENFQTYIQHITAPLYDSLGFESSQNGEHVTPYLRNIILDLNCRLGNQDCVNHVKKLLQNFRDNPINNRPDPDIRPIVYCSALREGDSDDFNFLWNQYLDQFEFNEKLFLLNALGCTSDEEHRTFYLNEVINDDSPVRQQDKHTIIVSVINSSPENAEAALEFCYEHWPAIQNRVQGLTGTIDILNAFVGRLTTEEHHNRIDQFLSRHSGVLTSAESTALGAIREDVSASIRWKNEKAAAVEAWLKIFGNSGNAITASLLVFISIVVALFNY